MFTACSHVFVPDTRGLEWAAAPRDSIDVLCRRESRRRGQRKRVREGGERERSEGIRERSRKVRR